MRFWRRRRSETEFEARKRRYAEDPADARLTNVEERLAAVESMISVLPSKINEELLERAARAEGDARQARRVLDEFIAAPEPGA